MPGDHALLSPSGASRWLVCTPSAKLGAQFPDEENEAAREGTLAHSLGELILKLKLGIYTKQKYNRELATIKSNELYDASMFGYCTDYAVHVLEKFHALQALHVDAKIFLETRLDLTTWIPESFGTSDVSMAGGGILNIDDFKYGKGVLVVALDNKQLKIYALGALKKFTELGIEIHTVRMSIFQPRLDNIDGFEISAAELLAWGEEIKPKAALAFKGEGEFVPGPHCQFCRVRNCRARAEKNLEIAKYDFKKPDLLDDAEIADILERSKDLVSWTSDIEEFALNSAISGTVYPGFKVVNGRSNRVISDEAEVRQGLIDKGFKPEEIEVTKLVSLTGLEGLVGKTDFTELFGEYIIKPLGKPTLVPLSDKRPEFGIASAINDFTPREEDIFIDDIL